MAMVDDFFDFELFEVVHEAWGRSRKIDSVLWSFMIRGQQGRVKYVMNGPGRREFQFVGHGGYSLQDCERAMTSRGKFQRLIRE